MSSYVDQMRAEIRRLLDESEQRVLETKRVAPGIIRRTIRVLFEQHTGLIAHVVPDWWIERAADIVVEYALEALDACLDTIRVLRVANEFLGSPDRMRAMGDTFQTVADTAENLWISKGDLQGWVTWDAGAPTKRYEAAIEDQSKALAVIAPKAAELKEVLRTHADDIESYYVNLLGVVVGSVAAIGGVIAAILSLIAAAVTVETGIGPVLGIIAAALSLVLAIVGVGVAGISAVQLFLANAQGTANKLDTLTQNIPKWEIPPFAIVQ